jgi:dinuclear metal center YbgI/SA1388 family protein
MALKLSAAVRLLENLAPLELAEAWDNVGLLLEPAGASERTIVRALLTIDLTSAVLDEAERIDANLVVAYHPPLFKPLARVRASHPGESVVARALSRGISVYSPHTALDAAPDGVNDWLAEACGPGETAPLVQAYAGERSAEIKLVVFVPKEHVDALRGALARAGAGVIGNYSECSFNLEGTGTFLGNEASTPSVGQAGELERAPEIRLEMVCPRRALPAISRALYATHPYEEPAWDVYPLSDKPRPGTGMGRSVRLTTPTPLSDAAERIKAHLGLRTVRVAAAERHRQGEKLATLAVCAGSGGALFEKAPGFDLYLTGELRHHDVLALNARGASVVLCDHTNTERGYLPRLRQRFETAAAGALEIYVSEADREPLVYA